MAEHHDVGSSVQHEVEPVGPSDEDPIGIGKPLRCREGRSGIGDGDVKSELTGHWYQFLGDVDRPHDHQVGTGHDAFDVDVMGPVGQRRRSLPIQQGDGVGNHVRRDCGR